MKMFHYTTIETLATILSSRTLRFNNLRNVDDPTEGVMDDFHSLQKYVFVSCWTNAEEENLALWKMYAKSAKGVRLEIDSFDVRFERSENPVTGIYKIVTNVEKADSSHFFINFWQNRVSINPYFEVRYTDEKKSFFSVRNEKYIEYNLENAICTKKTCWQFQNEVRFVLLGCSADTSDENVNWQHIFNRIVDGQEFNADYIDLALKESFFDNLKVCLGPSAGESEKIIVDALLAKYAVKNANAVENSVIELNEGRNV